MADIDEREWALLNSAMNGYVLSDALAAGCELGLFTFLARHPGSTCDAIARGIQASVHGTRALLLACTTAGLVHRDAASGAYTNASVAEKLLVEGKPDCFTSFVKFVHVVQKRGNWALARSVREGRNAGLDDVPGQGATLYDHLTSQPELEHLFHDAMGAYSRLAPKVVDVPVVADVRRLVDVGGGDGSVAAALCARNADLAVTLLDKPTVCAIAETSLARAGLAARVRCKPCDIFADAWPRDHDAVLMSHLVEIFSPAKIARLYANAFAALPPGGRCIVWTIVAHDDEDGGLQAAKSSLYFLSVASGEGMAYPARQHASWLREAGFASVVVHPVPAFDHAAIVATK